MCTRVCEHECMCKSVGRCVHVRAGMYGREREHGAVGTCTWVHAHGGTCVGMGAHVREHVRKGVGMCT